MLAEPLDFVGPAPAQVAAFVAAGRGAGRRRSRGRRVPPRRHPLSRPGYVRMTPPAPSGCRDAMDPPDPLPHLYSGKVRDIYDAGDDRLLMVTSDRLSAFDVVMAEPIPDKGRVLTAMSAFWFEHLADVVGSHLLSTDVDDLPDGGPAPGAGRAGSCCAAGPRCCPIECIVRGYITGSAWKEYRAVGHHARQRPARRPAGVRAAPGAGVHPVHQGRGRRPRREHLASTPPSTSSAPSWPSRPGTCPSSCTREGRRGPPSAASSSPTPSSSSAWSTASWSWPTRC